MPDYVSNEFIALNFKQPREGEQQLQRAAERIEQHTSYRVCDLWLSPRGEIGLLNLCGAIPGHKLGGWQRLRHEWISAYPRTNRLCVRRDMAILQTGYTTTPDRWFERSIREQGAGLLSDDAGGIAAFCVARFAAGEERLFAWSTRPGVRAIASADSEGAVIVGTRPRLVHALSRDFGPPSVDIDYLRGSLVGWSLDDRTPYAGTTLVSVDVLLCVASGRRDLKPHPTPAYERQSRIFEIQRAMYGDALQKAVEPLRGLSGFELRLSGGKDSRLVAAALSARGITPSTVISHGADDGEEAQIARLVATALGWRLQTRRPQHAYYGSLFETVRHNLTLSDGFLATEPRHLAFPVHSLVGDRGPGLVIGHIELQKGGWAGRARPYRTPQVDIGKGLVTRRRTAVVPELVDAATRVVDDYAASLNVADDRDYGFWINYRFRVCRWLTSHFLSHGRNYIPIYPLIDEKVTRVVCCAGLLHLVSERLLAETTWAFAPALREVPLVGKPYRFIRQRAQKARAETSSKDQAASVAEPAAPAADAPASAAATTPDLPPSSPSSAAPRPPSTRPHISEERAKEACDYIRHSRLRDELRALTLPNAWAVIEEPSHTQMLASQLDPLVLEELIWTYYQAALLYSDGLSSW